MSKLQDVYYDGARVGFFFEDGPGRVKITGKRHIQLIDGQASGKKIVTGKDGSPILKAPERPLASVRDEKVRWLRGQYERAMAGLDGYALSKSGVLPAMAMECSIWIVSNDPTDCPMLSAMAAAGGRDMDGEFVQEAMEKYHAFSSNAGRLSAKLEALEMTARRAGSKKEIEAVKW